MSAPVTWDGGNTDELAALAGDRFEGVAALVRTSDGELVPMLPGYVAARWPDGTLGIFSPGAWSHWAQAAVNGGGVPAHGRARP